MKNSVFIIYLLVDEQELSLKMLDTSQRIYNFLLFHAIILSVLDVLYALICYFIWFLGLTYQPRAQCQFLFFLVLEFRRKGISNGVQTEWNLRDDFSWTRRQPGDSEIKSEDPQGSHKDEGVTTGFPIKIFIEKPIF